MFRMYVLALSFLMSSISLASTLRCESDLGYYLDIETEKLADEKGEKTTLYKHGYWFGVFMECHAMDCGPECFACQDLDENYRIEAEDYENVKLFLPNIAPELEMQCAFEIPDIK